MDRVIALAKNVGAELVLANDPDADRLAVSVLHKGEYISLSGNDIGCLLAHYLLEQTPEAASDEAGDSTGQPLVVCSVVSSPMLLAIGEYHGAIAEQTLTGHKWIQNRGIQLEREQGLRFVFGYEEALGYGVGTLVRGQRWNQRGGGDGRLGSVVPIPGPNAHRRTRASLAQVRSLSKSPSLIGTPRRGGPKRNRRDHAETAENGPLPASGGVDVLACQDFDTGRRIAADGEESSLVFPKANVVVFELAGGHRAMLRPSGTEPKLKFYFDVRVQVQEGEPIEDAKARGEALLRSIDEDFRAKVQ